MFEGEGFPPVNRAPQSLCVLEYDSELLVGGFHGFVLALVFRAFQADFLPLIFVITLKRSGYSTKIIFAFFLAQPSCLVNMARALTHPAFSQRTASESYVGRPDPLWVLHEIPKDQKQAS